MTTRRPLTAQIKPETRNAIMDQLAAAADEIVDLLVQIEWHKDQARVLKWKAIEARILAQRRWWHRLMWWRA